MINIKDFDPNLIKIDTKSYKNISIYKSGEYEKDYMRIKFNSDDNLSLNKQLKLHMVTIIVRSVFEEDSIYHPQVFLDDCLYEV